MKALCWYGTNEVRIARVPDPKILNPRDAIVKVTLTAICGSDLHLLDGFIPTLKRGDILGHEFMGEIVAVGPEITKLKIGDRVVVPFTIACGRCFFCERELWSACDNSNPNAWMLEKVYGFGSSGLFGYSHLLGGYAGGQAQYVRVPFAGVGSIKVPESLSDDQVLFLSDILPTGYMAAENCNIQSGDTVAIWGCGPVGQFAIKSAFLLGAERVIALDRFREEASLATWFYQIVVRQAHNYCRWRMVRQTWSAFWSGRTPEASSPAAGDPLLRRRIAKALAQLSRSQKEAFVLVHLEGFSVREAAALMEKPEGTVKSHLHRALQTLRRELADLAEDTKGGAT